MDADAREPGNDPAAREELRRLIDDIAERFADVDPDEHEREVRRAIDEIRAEMWAEAAAAAATQASGRAGADSASET